MGKKNKNSQVAAVEAPVRSGPQGGILFEASDNVIQTALEQTRLGHVNKPWSRHAWERAIPWVLSQKQKLEGIGGWSHGDTARTELFVLKRLAPSGVYTEDGYLYVPIPKKMIDFMRTARKNSQADNDNDDDDHDEENSTTDKKKRHVTSKISKKREARCHYDLSDPNVWKIKIDGADTEEPGKVPNVQVDVSEPLENIFNLVQCLQPGLLRLYAWRENVIQQGTHEIDNREDAEPPTARHRAMIAASESYTRVLPPAYWFKRNRDELQKILGEGFEPTMRAAEDEDRTTTRTIKSVEEKVWEEVLKVQEKPVRKTLKKKNPNKSNKAATTMAGHEELAAPTVASAA